MSDGRWSTTVTGDRCRRMATHARSLDKVVTDYTSADPGWAGLPGSQGESERLVVKRDGSVEFEVALGACQSVLHLDLLAVVLHLKTIALLLEAEDPPADSIMVLSRTILELSARAWWLADPAIDPHDRIARGFLERLRSAYENELFTSSSIQGGVTAVTTVESVTRDIQALSIPVADCGKGNFKVGSQTRPNATDLLRSFPGDDVAGPHDSYFRLFSAPTHGTLYGIMLLYSGPPLDALGRTTATYQVTQAWLDGPTSTSVLASAWALHRVVRLLGWDEEPLNACLRLADDLYT